MGIIDPSPAHVPPAIRQHPPATLAIFDEVPATHRLDRRVATTADGHNWRLYTAVPRQVPPSSGFPILYMLDGNAAFDTLTSDDLARVPGLAIVGIGHDTPLRFDVLGRTRDYTPPRSTADPSPDPANSARVSGGADQFLDALTGQLRQFSEDGIPVDPARRSVWGHSLAALFVLYARLARPAAFSGYAAASPSVWWNSGWLLDYQSRRPADLAPADMLVMMGDSERRSSPAGPHWQGPSPFTLDFVRQMRQRDAGQVTFEIFPGLSHAETLPASFTHALAFATAI